MRRFYKAAIAAMALMGTAMLASAPAKADVGFGISFGYDGGYFSDPCDYYDYYDQAPPWGLPPDYCQYPVYFEPVYFGGDWYRGPIYYRWYGGQRMYWLNGGWRRDEWRGSRPSSIRWTDRGGWHGRDGWNNSHGGWHGRDGWGNNGWGRRDDYGRSDFRGGRDAWNRGGDHGDGNRNGGWNRGGGHSADRGSWGAPGHSSGGGNPGFQGGGHSGGYQGGGFQGGRGGWSGGHSGGGQSGQNGGQGSGHVGGDHHGGH